MANIARIDNLPFRYTRFFTLLRNARIFPLGIILNCICSLRLLIYFYQIKVCISTAPYAGMDSVGDILDMPISCPSLTITGMSQAKHVGHSSISIIPLATSPSVLIKFASETLWYCALIVLHTPPPNYGKWQHLTTSS